MAERSLNKVQLIGRLGADPESRYTQGGSAMTTFRIATSKFWVDQQSNERRDRTDWHAVVCWGRLAEISSQYLKKGSQVYVEGELQTRTYDREGQTHYRTEVNCRELIMLGARSDSQDMSPGNVQYDRPATAVGGGNYGNRPADYSRESSNTNESREIHDEVDDKLDDDLPF